MLPTLAVIAEGRRLLAIASVSGVDDHQTAGEYFREHGPVLLDAAEELGKANQQAIEMQTCLGKERDTLEQAEAEVARLREKLNEEKARAEEWKQNYIDMLEVALAEPPEAPGTPIWDPGPK